MANNVEVAALGYFMKQGLSPAQAAGIVGNLKQESSLNPRAPGGGLAQWIGARWSNLVRFAQSRGASPDSAGAQLEFLWHELTTTESGTLANLKRTKTPQEAARVFSQQYERPGLPELANRERYAVEAYKTAAKGQSGLLEKFAQSGSNPLSFGKSVVEGVVTSSGNVLAPVEKAIGGAETLGKLGGTVLGWIENPLTPVKFVGGAVLLYVGVRTLTGGTGPAKETSRAVSHAKELAAIIPK